MHNMSRTAPQQERFNYPYQLGTNSSFTPASAAPFLFYAKPGDIVVMATDGLVSISSVAVNC
jgi:hypothetical protein